MTSGALSVTVDEALLLLGVQRTTDPKEFRRAYLTLVKKHKPDQDPEGFRRLREAYELATQAAAWGTFIPTNTGNGEPPAESIDDEFDLWMDLPASPLLTPFKARVDAITAETTANDMACILIDAEQAQLAQSVWFLLCARLHSVSREWAQKDVLRLAYQGGAVSLKSMLMSIAPQSFPTEELLQLASSEDLSTVYPALFALIAKAEYRVAGERVLSLLRAHPPGTLSLSLLVDALLGLEVVREIEIASTLRAEIKRELDTMRREWAPSSPFEVKQLIAMELDLTKADSRTRQRADSAYSIIARAALSNDPENAYPALRDYRTRDPSEAKAIGRFLKEKTHILNQLFGEALRNKYVKGERRFRNPSPWLGWVIVFGTLQGIKAVVRCSDSDEAEIKPPSEQVVLQTPSRALPAAAGGNIPEPPEEPDWLKQLRDARLEIDSALPIATRAAVDQMLESLVNEDCQKADRNSSDLNMLVSQTDLQVQAFINRLNERRRVLCQGNHTGSGGKGSSDNK
jgi:hypothetical protein